MRTWTGRGGRRVGRRARSAGRRVAEPASAAESARLIPRPAVRRRAGTARSECRRSRIQLDDLAWQASDEALLSQRRCRERPVNQDGVGDRRQVAASRQDLERSPAAVRRRGRPRADHRWRPERCAQAVVRGTRVFLPRSHAHRLRPVRSTRSSSTAMKRNSIPTMARPKMAMKPPGPGSQPMAAPPTMSTRAASQSPTRSSVLGGCA